MVLKCKLDKIQNKMNDQGIVILHSHIHDIDSCLLCQKAKASMATIMAQPYHLELICHWCSARLISKVTRSLDAGHQPHWPHHQEKPPLLLSDNLAKLVIIIEKLLIITYYDVPSLDVYSFLIISDNHGKPALSSD